jgi:hypothetical protein
MGVSIQFESHTVELWAIYLMEHDPDVLEFYDQPQSVDRNLVYADGAIKLAKPLVSPLAISYTLLEKRA